MYLDLPTYLLACSSCSAATTSTLHWCYKMSPKLGSLRVLHIERIRRTWSETVSGSGAVVVVPKSQHR